MPEWIGPQLTELVEAAPDGDEWLHETKFDGYCTHARMRASRGMVSKRADAAYAPGNRGLWLKVKWLYRQEFIVVGWSIPRAGGPG